MKNKNPWTTISREKIYENPWILLWEDEVISPGGGKGIYGKVHFKNRALGIIPLDRDLNTWLVGQYRYTLNEYTWEIPMGGGPLTEDPLVSAKRELKEETGLMAESWDLILRIHTSNSVTDEEGFCYMARDLSEGAPQFDETEDISIKKLHFTAAVEMVLNGEITDSLSVAGILKADHMLRENRT